MGGIRRSSSLKARFVWGSDFGKKLYWLDGCLEGLCQEFKIREFMARKFGTDLLESADSFGRVETFTAM